MNCRTCEKWLSRHQDEALSPDDRRQLATHLADCSACRARRQAYASLQTRLRDLPSAPVSTVSLTQQALTRRQTEIAAQSRVGFGTARFWVRAGFAFAGASALLFAANAAFHRSDSVVPPTPVPITGSGTRPKIQSHYIVQSPSINDGSAPVRSASSTNDRYRGRYAPTVRRTEKATTNRPFRWTISRMISIPVVSGWGHDAPASISTKADPETKSTKPGAPRVDDLAYINISPAGWQKRWIAPAPRLVRSPVCNPKRNAIPNDASQSAPISRPDDFIVVAIPPIAGQGDRAIRAAIAAQKKEEAIVDERLAQKVTLTAKSLPFSELCRQLRDQTGIGFTANANVADDNITVFCKNRPVRDVMRQISRLFGFTWTRNGTAPTKAEVNAADTAKTQDKPKPENADSTSGIDAANGYRYELSQSIRSQFLEEGLRTRTKEEALLALDAEMQKYRKFLDLTPQQARERAQTASGEDKEILNQLANGGWAPAHLYFGLSPDQLGAMAGGQAVSFGTSAEFGDNPLSGDLQSGLMHTFDDWRFERSGNGEITMVAPDKISGVTSTTDKTHFRKQKEGAASPNAESLSAFSNVGGAAALLLDGKEAGQVALNGRAKFVLPGTQGSSFDQWSSLAVGVSPTIRTPDNAKENAKLAPTMRESVTILPKPARRFDDTEASGGKTTSGDVWEALYKATGRDLIADSYTRLYAPETVTIRDTPLFDALNRLGDRMRLKWKQDDGFLQFRSTSFFFDRQKEVPKRLLAAWAESRKRHGFAIINDLIGIARLKDTPLDSEIVEEGAKELWGLAEWHQGRNLRNHWRFFAGLTPAQKQTAQSEKGLGFANLPGRQQNQYMALAYSDAPEREKVEYNEMLVGTFRLDYPQPDAEGHFTNLTAGPEAKFIYRYGRENTTGTRTRTFMPYGVSAGQVKKSEGAK